MADGACSAAPSGSQGAACTGAAAITRRTPRGWSLSSQDPKRRPAAAALSSSSRPRLSKAAVPRQLACPVAAPQGVARPWAARAAWSPP